MLFLCYFCCEQRWHKKDIMNYTLSHVIRTLSTERMSCTMSKVLAVILAGGQGERLSLLSQKRAKPAVPFAGKYRIIDFALSNCVNSGITDVAVLTQYRPHSLHEHIGIGKPWDLDREKGGIYILQPYRGHQESDWYQGTADAVYQNLDFIMESRYDYVLILAGDHIYRMDYGPMIAFHQQRTADVTLGAVVIPIEEGHRFGTVQSYWEAHMELLGDHPAFDLYDRSWVIHTRSEERPPAHIRSGAQINSSLISHGCIIKGQVERSVLSPGVVVEEGAVVRDSILLFDTIIGTGSVIDRAILDKEVVVGKHCQIGYGEDMTPNKWEPGRLNTGITLIGKRVHLPDNLKVGRNCKIGTDLRPDDFPSDTLASGETIEDRTFKHGWERELARRISPTP